MDHGVVSLHVMIETALVMANKLSLDAHLIAFAMAAYSAAVVAVKCMLTNGLAVHQNVVTLVLVPTGSVGLQAVDVLGAGQLAGNQEISCDDSVRDC